MDDKQTLNSSESTNQHSPGETEESEVVSRRSFMRKSAEVAAISLFGVLGLDAIVDKVLERIAESQAVGKLSDAAAGALKEHKLDHYANAGIGGCQACTHCHMDYGCDATEVSCTQFYPDGCDSPQNPYGCTIRDLSCSSKFVCGTNNCDDSRFTCTFNG